MKILYVKNSNTRAKEFQLTTTIYEVDGQKYVKKTASTQDAIPHLKNMAKNYEKLSNAITNPKVQLAKIVEESAEALVFEYIEGQSLEERFYDAIERDLQEAYGVIDRYRRLLNESFKTTQVSDYTPDAFEQRVFGESTKGVDERRLFETPSNIDMLFSNIIERDGITYLIDYEWVFDFAVSVDFVLYRALSQLKREEIVEYYFDTKELELYRKQEENFILGYVLNRDSFFQIQHHYLKNRLTIEEETQKKIQQANIIKEQNRYNEELIEQIAELKDIAQSLRIKNRIKKIAPKITPTKLIAPLRTIQKNPTLLKKALYYAKRGEFGYLYKKIREKNSQNITQSKNLTQINPQEYFKPFVASDYPMGERIIDVIIPVYNGYKFLTPLFDSIERNTTTPYRLIVVNDASPDERVKPLLLERLEKHPSSIFIDHEANLGFVKSVTEAYSHTSSHFLILNTDTEVPSYWIERLMHPILNMERVASTTPFTNSGQIASFPNFIADNNIFEGMSVDALDQHFKQVNPENFYTQVPTGVGFCMGVNYDLIQDIGFFVEKEFGRGYGEENDWCQRAIRAGYKNLMVPNLFVYHKHGGSFSAEDKAKLMKENAIKLLHKHPNYDKDVANYVAKDPHQILRNILVIVASSHHEQGLYLIIDQALGGGANHYTSDLIEQYKKENKKILHLVYDYYASSYNIHFDYKEYHFSYRFDSLQAVQIFIAHLHIEEIFLNNLVSFQEKNLLFPWIEKLAKGESRLIIPIHDYYPVCPNYTLLDPQGEFCEIPHSLQTCQTCLKNNKLEWKTFVQDDIDIRSWRSSWSRLLRLSEKIICFSDSSKELLLRAYREIEASKIEIIPHSAAPLKPIEQKEKSETPYKTIGILGAINQAKGANIIEKLVKEIDEKSLPIKVVLIGEISKNISSNNFTVTGRYQREQLPELVVAHDIDIFLLPSVCPETFSYTTQEIIMMDMPLMVFDIGAPAKRASHYDKGVVLSKEYVENILKYMQQLEDAE